MQQSETELKLCDFSFSGRTPEELIPAFRKRLFYKELYNAVTDGLLAKLTNSGKENVFAFVLFLILLVVFCYIVLSLLRENESNLVYNT